MNSFNIYQIIPYNKYNLYKIQELYYTNYYVNIQMFIADLKAKGIHGFSVVLF